MARDVKILRIIFEVPDGMSNISSCYASLTCQAARANRLAFNGTLCPVGGSLTWHVLTKVLSALFWCHEKWRERRLFDGLGRFMRVGVFTRLTVAEL